VNVFARTNARRVLRSAPNLIKGTSSAFAVELRWGGHGYH